MWEKPGLNYLENCDSLSVLFRVLGKRLLYACEDFFLGRATTSEQGMVRSLLSLLGPAPYKSLYNLDRSYGANGLKPMELKNVPTTPRPVWLSN